MKEIVLDTETTGISIKDGHRIVEIGCIELNNLIPTQNKFGFWLAIGVAIGTSIGGATENLQI